MSEQTKNSEINEELAIKLEIAKFFKDGNKYDVDVKGLVEYIKNTRTKESK